MTNKFKLQVAVEFGPSNNWWLQHKSVNANLIPNNGCMAPVRHQSFFLNLWGDWSDASVCWECAFVLEGKLDLHWLLWISSWVELELMLELQK